MLRTVIGLVLMGSMLVVPGVSAGATAPDPAISRDIEALRTSRDFGAELDGYLETAVKAVEQEEECEAATALQSFADQVSYTDAARQAARLRGRVLAVLPDEKGCAGPITVYADPDKIKVGDPLPGEQGTTRPVAALVDQEGRRSEFVADELLLSTDDEAELDKFVARWDGKVLNRIDGGPTPTYLVRITTERAEPEKLGDHLAALNGDQRKATALAVSGEQGLRLLAAAAAEATEKLEVGVNWVYAPTDFADRKTTEAGHGVPGFTVGSSLYTRDAYQWSYLSSVGAQAIGVAEAWTVLDSIGRLDNTVELGIVDQGFAPAVNGDLPANPDMVSVVASTDPGTPGIPGARWHGTQAATAAAGVPDNFIGGAGPAGPVAHLNLVYIPYTTEGMMVGLHNAKWMGSKIINFSMGMSVHWSMAWTLLVLNSHFRHARESGVLIYASAMNDGEDVDAVTCFIGCWESAWHTPCEFGGVRCVGGLDIQSRNRHPNSNHGDEDVDIFAPYQLLHGADPGFPDQSTVRKINGTSFSSPFAAGVAALVWAADPTMSADRVDSLVMNHLGSSSDATVGRRVINALSAVRDALPPLVRITTPHDGQTISALTPTQFKANVFDDGLGTPTVTWTLNGTTVLGQGTSITATPPPGTFQVRATAVFPGGQVATDQINVTVQNLTPAMKITGPLGGVFGRTEPIPFHATSLDDIGQLPENAVRWYLDGSQNSFATGHNPVVPLATTPGQHTVTVRGCDTFGLCGSDTVTVSIIPDSANQPPQVRITNPANGAKLWVNGNSNGQYFHEITLNATATDPEGGAVTLVWKDNGTVIGTGPNPQVRLLGGCGDAIHDLTLIGTDGAGNSRQDTVQVMVSLVC
ncbi:S8 family serine peptidase [Acrocarpospora catenulata]|uniref:S8 family serine peptidase n=1 Tax=Acrocarpospora catenulata TaxID=2836182 RepID=UPI001BD9CC5C|nr:S8 family serine peptidase [Acrocarpospora catenulata]